MDADDDSSENQSIYWECEQKCRKYTQRLSYFVILHISLFPVVLLYALVCIASGNYDTSKWHLFFYVAVPYDQTCVWGWFLTWLIQLFMAFTYIMCMSTITSFFVSGCYYICAMCDNFSVLIKSVSTLIERMRTEVKPQKIGQTFQQTDTQLRNAIKLQVKIYEYVKNIVEIQ